jgi:hypothetical protein
LENDDSFNQVLTSSIKNSYLIYFFNKNKDETKISQVKILTEKVKKRSQ